MEDNELLTKIKGWKSESETLRTRYDQRWAKNLKLVKGINADENINFSNVRKRSKIFYRKIWATVWRLVASFYAVFLRDPESFKITGRGAEDERKAKLLQYMTEYRRDVLNRESSLFLKHLWAMFNIGYMGIGIGKMRWVYDDELGIDGPDYIVYPNEQVFFDMAAETPDRMRYIIFESYMSKDEIEEAGYENLDKAQVTAMPSNSVRGVRHMGKTDPLQNPGPNEYPAAGRYEDGTKDQGIAKYKVWECFYRQKGKAYFCATNGEHPVFFKSPDESPYGRKFPVVMGVCLTEPHMMIGEGFPEPLEGPQESYNFNLNSRKDNLSLALNKMHIVNRYANVDLQSLVNSRAGGIVMADDIGAIAPIETPDVTQSSYMEASQDDGMMQEMSGVTDIIAGNSKSDKATVAQLNYSQASAKIDLYAAIVAETYFKEFYTLLAYMIQRFETDEKVFRIANDKLRKEERMPYADESYDIDFLADAIIEVGAGTVGRDLEVRNTLLAMDRAIMANQATVAMMSAGMKPQNPKIFDLTKFMEALLPKIGYKNIQDYSIPLGQGQQALGNMGGGGGAMPDNGAMRGAMSPQIGDMQASMPDMANITQQGGLGGI